MTKHDNVSQEGIMKATEFVKKFGWDSLLIAKTLPKLDRYKYVIFYADEIDFSNEFLEKHKDYMFESQEIKRLVESHELVEKAGGLMGARKEAHKDCFEFKSNLLRAIADVEACQ